MLRYHIMTVEPGKDSNGDYDWDTADANVVDMRAGEQVASYSVSECGDGVYNSTYEICEYTMNPSRPAADFGYYD